MVETSTEERFWSKVVVGSADECWPWAAGLHQSGTKSGRYGAFRLEGRTVRAPRMAYELTTGLPVPAGLMVCHRCDNPICVNPSHLWLGTAADNNLDMRGKNRHCHGERKPGAKLTESDVRATRRLHAAGMSMAELARQFGVSKSAVKATVRLVTWKHVE